MLILFSGGFQEGQFDVEGGAVAGGHSESHRYLNRPFIVAGGAVAGGHARSRRFYLVDMPVEGGAVAGGHSPHRTHRSFSVTGGAVAGGLQRSPRRRQWQVDGGAVGGGHVITFFERASANMREILLEGNAAAMIELAAMLETVGFPVTIAPDYLRFWLRFESINITIYFDLVDRGLMRIRQAINSGTEAAPIWIYGTPVYLFLRYRYDCPGWLFFTPKYIYLVARHDRSNLTPYDIIFAGAANSPGTTTNGFPCLIGGSTTGAVNLLPLTTTSIVAAGISMNSATLTGQSVLHLKSLSSYFGAGKNGNAEGVGVTATEIIICDSASQVKGSLPNGRSTQGANLQAEQMIKTPSSRWLTFQNNNSSVILQR